MLVFAHSLQSPARSLEADIHMLWAVHMLDDVRVDGSAVGRFLEVVHLLLGTVDNGIHGDEIHTSEALIARLVARSRPWSSCVRCRSLRFSYLLLALVEDCWCELRKLA